MLFVPFSWNTLPHDVWRTRPFSSLRHPLHWHSWGGHSLTTLFNVVYLQSLFMTLPYFIFFKALLMNDLAICLRVYLFITFLLHGAKTFLTGWQTLGPKISAWMLGSSVNAPALPLVPLLYNAPHLSRPQIPLFLLWQMSQRKKYCKCGKRDRA